MSKPSNKHLRPVLALFDRQAWRYFFSCYRERGKRLLLLSFAAALRALLLVPILIMIREIFDVAIPTSNQILLLWLAGGIIVARLLHGAILVLIRRFIIRDIQQAIMEIRADLVTHLYRLNRSFYASADSNSLQARIVQDTARVDQMSNALFSAVIPALFTSAVLILLLFALQWQLTLLACLAVPLVFLTTRYAGRVVQARIKVFQHAFEQFSKGIQFSLRYMCLTQEQGAAESESARRKAELADLCAKSETMAQGYLLSGQLNETVMTVVGMLVVVAGAMAIMNASLTLGEFIAFYSAAGLLSGQLGTLTGRLPDILSGNESLRKLEALYSEDAPNPYQGRRALDFGGHIAFKQISFSYAGEGLLKDVDLLIYPGETVLISGPNGAGKSTLLHLLMGFWRPDKGQLLADDVRYDELDIPALRRSLGFVPQRPDVFSGSVADNVRYGKGNISDGEIEAAARMSGAHAFIEKMPDKDQSQIGDDGCKLSGGERQKLAIARALVARPVMLILDEPTNHLDAEAVGEILENLRKQTQDIALLIVSHDKRVAAFADRTFHLQEGRLNPIPRSQQLAFPPAAGRPDIDELMDFALHVAP